MSDAFVVVNPAAGGGRTGRLWPRLREDLVRLGLRFEWAATAAGGEATGLATRAARDGWPLIVAVGGDGTLNEVVNGVAGNAGPPRVTVGAILTGRGRDACRNLGIPLDPRAAAGRLVAGEDASVDLGVVEWPDGTRRCFVNAAGAGFDAEVARRAAAHGGSGTVPYVLGLLGALAAHRPGPATVLIDGAVAWSEPTTTVVVANAPHFGGGMRIAPGADPTDGALDVVLVGALGRWELLRWFPTVYRGAHLGHPRVSARRARHVRIEAAAPVEIDGEPGRPTPVVVSVRPQALRLRR